MARIRTIKPDFFKHEEIAELPAMARLLFIGLWTQADRMGRMEDRPKRLKAEVFPYDNYDVDKGLCLLSDRGFIVRYKVNANRSVEDISPRADHTEAAYIQIVNFSKHQQPNIKEKESTIPAPCQHGTSITGKGTGNKEEDAGEEKISDDGLPAPITARPAHAPPDEQVFEFFYQQDKMQMADAFIEKHNSNGWTDSDGKPIGKWKVWAIGWITRTIASEEKAAKKAEKESKKPKPQESSWVAGNPEDDY